MIIAALKNYFFLKLHYIKWFDERVSKTCLEGGEEHHEEHHEELHEELHEERHEELPEEHHEEHHEERQ